MKRFLLLLLDIILLPWELNEAYWRWLRTGFWFWKGKLK